MAQIPLKRHGKIVAHALVDDCDLLRLSAFSWRLNDRGYPSRTLRRSERASQGPYQLGREVLRLPVGDPREADHINGDKLDNRRSNLRAVTPQQHGQNCPARGGSSPHRGVTFHSSAGKWQAQVHVEGRNHYLGLFADEQDAADAARAFRSEHMPFAVESAVA